MSKAIPIRDERLLAFVVLLAPCFVGYAIQGLTEDVPWLSELATRRYWVTPGWHLYLSPYVPAAIAVALAFAALITSATRRRAAFMVLLAIYLAHYLTYPYRIRNHMSTMLFGLGVVGLVWTVARAQGALVVRAGAPTHAWRVDRWAANGLASVLVVQYFFAGLHKLNPAFVDPSLEGPSVAIRGLSTFWIYGDLGSEPPHWIRVAATWGSIAIETCVPLIAWRVRRLSYLGVLLLMAFNVPIIAALDIPDYPLIASAFFPALLSRGQWRLLRRHLGPSLFTLSGAALGAFTQVWFMPWWGLMSSFGIFVLALWGWSVGALIRLTWTGLRKRRASTQRG